jgi:hypothetical protein
MPKSNDAPEIIGSNGQKREIHQATHKSLTLIIFTFFHQDLVGFMGL